MKHFKHFIFLLILMFILVKVSAQNLTFNHTNFLEFKEAKEEILGTLNPMWEYYNSLPEEEKEKWEAIPEKYVVFSDSSNYLNYYAKRKAYAPLVYGSSLPVKYDLREQNAVSPVENQGRLDICWAFAANASLESNMLLNNQGSHTFSERQIDYASANESYWEGFNPYGTRYLTSGGTFYNAARFYAMGFSPVEMKGIWTNWNESTNLVNFSDVFNTDNNDFLVTDYVMFPSIDMQTASSEDKESLREKIKQHIMEHGAVYISTASAQKSSAGACYIPITGSDMPGLINWNESCEAPFATKVRSGSHAMAIIGWDDGFTLSYCAYPNGNTETTSDSSSCSAAGGKYYQVSGAWILKNSWGNVSPYLYLAYDSKYIEAAGITKVVNKDYDNGYNTYGPVLTASNSSSTIFVYSKPTPTEKLKMISFNTSTTTPITYQVYYGDRASNYYYVGSVTATTPGRYSVTAHGEELNQEDFVIFLSYSYTDALGKPTSVYAFTDNTTENPSANSTINTANPIVIGDGINSSRAYLYLVETRVSNLPSDTKLSYLIKDKYDNVVWSQTDDNAYVLGGAYEGYLTLNNKLQDSTIYYLETYANNALIGRNSFATGINLGTKVINDNLHYIINNQEDLKYLTTNEYKFERYVLGSDIDLANTNFTPLGTGIIDQFRGTLEGDNHTIYNLTENTNNTGLFYKLEGNVSNLKIKNASLTGSNTSGVLASIAYEATIENVLTQGTLTSTNPSAYIGGLVGEAYNINFKNIVNETSLANGKAGAITGYMGKSTKINNALNQGLISGNNSAISTFFHSSALSGNVIDSLVDLTIETDSSCGTPYSNLSSDNLKYSNIVYPKEDNCTYIGTKVAREDFKKSSTYNGYNSGWVIKDDNLPYIKDNPVTYITDVKNVSVKNLFVDSNSLIELETEPEDATYKGVKVKVNTEGIVKVINGNMLQGLSPGKALITITTNDGSYITKDATIYVLNNDLKSIYQDGYLIVFENVSKDYLQMGEYTVNSSTERIGTGTRLTYQIGENVVGDFKAIIKGDINKDGQIQADDILLMKRHILELDRLNPLDNEQLYAGNISGDGITSLGILKMQRHILNLDGGGKLE